MAKSQRRECEHDLSVTETHQRGQIDPVELECLASIIEEGGFERAAQRLLISQSSVSQRLLTLEKKIGQLLVIRSRPAKPTSAGKLLLKHAKKVRVLRADLDRELRMTLPRDTRGPSEVSRISVALDTDSLTTWALPALGRTAGNDHLLEVLTDEQRPTYEWLVEGRVQGCVTTTEHPPSGCTSTPLGTWEYVAVAQKAFATQQCPLGLGPNNFRHLPFIARNRSDDSQAEFAARALGLKQVLLNQIYIPSTEARLAAVLAGWGVSFISRSIADAQIACGALVDVAPYFVAQTPLYWHSWSIESPVLTQLSSELSMAAGEYLAQNPRNRGNSCF